MARNVRVNGPVVTITYTAGGTIAAGTLHNVGDVCGVNMFDVVSGQTGTLIIEGIVTLPKSGSEEWPAAGAPVYKSTTNATVVPGTDGKKFVGYTAATALTAATSGRVLLSRGAPGPTG